MMDDLTLLLAQRQCALISEGRCPTCRSALVERAVDSPDEDGDRWGCCWWCSVAYRCGGHGDSWWWTSRMITHWSLDEFTDDLTSREFVSVLNDPRAEQVTYGPLEPRTS